MLPPPLSLFANSQGDTGIGGIGLVCDAVHPRECRASSDFDLRNNFTTDASYQLPFGKGRMFANSGPLWVDEAIGGWDVSGIGEWHRSGGSREGPLPGGPFFARQAAANSAEKNRASCVPSMTCKNPVKRQQAYKNS
jgi:hypothetical protein